MVLSEAIDADSTLTVTWLKRPASPSLGVPEPGVGPEGVSLVPPEEVAGEDTDEPLLPQDAKTRADISAMTAI